MKDELRHEFVCYNRLKLQEETYLAALRNIEVEHQRKLDYFIKLSKFFASVLRDISDMKEYRRTNHISIGYLLTTLEESLKDASKTLAIDNILKDTLNVILGELVNRFNSFDFQFIFMMIGIRKLVFEGTLTQHYGQVLFQVITHRLKSTRQEYIKVFFCNYILDCS